jgi:hypothetical protein
MTAPLATIRTLAKQSQASPKFSRRPSRPQLVADETKVVGARPQQREAVDGRVYAGERDATMPRRGGRRSRRLRARSMTLEDAATHDKKILVVDD